MKARKMTAWLLALAVAVSTIPGNHVNAAGTEAASELSAGTAEDGVYKHTFSGSSTRKEIQDVLNYIRDGQAKKLELTLKGTISIDGCLYVYSNTTINATGATIKATATNGSLLAAATGRNFDGSYPKGYRTTENITIKGGTWDGNKKSGQVIRFVHATNVSLDGLTIRNCSNLGHLLSLEGVNQATVKNCDLQGHPGMEKAKEALHLDIVHSEETTPDLLPAEYDDLPNRNITITDNTIKNAPNAIGSHGGVDGVHHQNINIENNIISNITGAGVKAFNYKKVKITGNTISYVGSGIKVYTNVGGSEEGEVYYTPKKGAAIEPLPKDHDYEITIKNNKLDHIKGISAIQSQGAKNRIISGVVIENNTINDSVYKGIWLLAYSPKAIVRNNMISNTKGNGIDARVCSNGSIIEKNRITSAGASGITVLNTIKNVTVKDNVVTNGKEHGIWIYNKASNVTVTGNTVNGTAQNGIYVSEKSDNAIVGGNTIKGTIKSSGIHVFKSKKAKVADNKIGAVKGRGIAIDVGSDNASVKKNTMKSAGKQGMYVYKANGVKLENNVISKAGSHGVQVSESAKASAVTGNTIKNAKGNGIHLYNAKNMTIKRNKITGVTKRGVSLEGKSDNAKVLENTITKTKQDGINAYRINGLKVQDNTLMKIGNTGIRASQGGNLATVSGNKLTGISMFGIEVRDTRKAEIKNNTLKEVKDKPFVVVQTGADVSTMAMPTAPTASVKKKTVDGTAYDVKSCVVNVNKKDYAVKVKNNTYKTKKISGIKKGTGVTVTMTLAGKNTLIVETKAK